MRAERIEANRNGIIAPGVGAVAERNNGVAIADRIAADGDGSGCYRAGVVTDGDGAGAVGVGITAIGG